VIIFGAGIFEFLRTEISGGKDGGVDGFEGADGGMKGNASASRSDSAAVTSCGGGEECGGWDRDENELGYCFE